MIITCIWPKKAFTLLSDLHSSSIKSFSSVILAIIRFDLSDLYLQWFFKCNQVQPICRSLKNCGNPQILHSRTSPKTQFVSYFLGCFFQFTHHFWGPHFFEKSFFPTPKNPHQSASSSFRSPFHTGVKTSQDDAGPGLTAGCVAWLFDDEKFGEQLSLLPKNVVFG